MSRPIVAVLACALLLPVPLSCAGNSGGGGGDGGDGGGFAGDGGQGGGGGQGGDPTGGGGGGGEPGEGGGAGEGGAGGGGGSGGSGGSGGGEPTGDIRCGGGTCELGEEICCSRPGPPTTFTCQDAGAACPGGAVLCDGPEDCGDRESCCIRFAGGALPAAACEATATCTGQGTSRACGTEDDCGQGESCCTNPTFGYSSGFCWPGGCP